MVNSLTNTFLMDELATDQISVKHKGQNFVRQPNTISNLSPTEETRRTTQAEVWLRYIYNDELKVFIITTTTQTSLQLITCLFD